MTQMPKASASRTQRLACRSLATLAGLVALHANAALWEDQLWAVSGEADVTAGYDSNLYAITDGPGDSFAEFKPSLDLSRKDSLLNFNADAWVNWTTFLKHTNDDATDPGLRLTLSYPANVDELITQAGEFHWIRTTAVDVDIGQRVSQDDLLAKYEGDIINTGKTAVVGRVSFDRDEYLGAPFDTIDTAALGTSAFYSPDNLFRAGLGYDLTLGRSQPNSPGLPSLDETEQAFTIQAEGEFTPKLTGKFSIGAGYTRYTGSFSNSEWDTVASGGVVWTPRDRLAFDLQVVRAPYFSADGDADINTSAVLGVTQGLGNGFSVKAHVQDGLTNYERTTTYRTDTIKGTGAGVAYDLTGKLTASAGCDWTRQDSDLFPFTYRRYVATGELTYKF